ncbi:hypothetical protein PCE1_002109 [Barthelona sp. PCE]
MANFEFVQEHFETFFSLRVLTNSHAKVLYKFFRIYIQEFFSQITDFSRELVKKTLFELQPHLNKLIMFQSICFVEEISEMMQFFMCNDEVSMKSYLDTLGPIKEEELSDLADLLVRVLLDLSNKSETSVLDNAFGLLFLGTKILNSKSDCPIFDIAQVTKTAKKRKMVAE